METAAAATEKVTRGGHILVLLLIMAAAFAVYGRVYDHLFLMEWGDPEYLVGNMQSVRGSKEFSGIMADYCGGEVAR